MWVHTNMIYKSSTMNQKIPPMPHNQTNYFHLNKTNYFPSSLFKPLPYWKRATSEIQIWDGDNVVWYLKKNVSCEQKLFNFPLRKYKNILDIPEIQLNNINIKSKPNKSIPFGALIQTKATYTSENYGRRKGQVLFKCIPCCLVGYLPAIILKSYI